MGDTIRIYTDGAYSIKADTGGWAFVVAGENHFRVRGKGSGGEASTTNNRMELTAITRAVAYAYQHHRGDNVIIVTDSQYAMRSATIPLPKPNQSGGVAVKIDPKNIDLIRELQGRLAMHPSITFEWVKGHSTDLWNVTADRLAVRALGTVINQQNRAKRVARKDRTR